MWSHALKTSSSVDYIERSDRLAIVLRMSAGPDRTPVCRFSRVRVGWIETAAGYGVPDVGLRGALAEPWAVMRRPANQWSPTRRATRAGCASRARSAAA